MAGETEAKPVERRAGGTRWRWAIVAAAALVVVLLVASFRLLPFGTEIMADVHRRNAQDLEIVAQRLESWSDAIGGVARGNYIRGRVGAIEPGDRDFRDGWQVRARMRHPELGSYRVVYRAVKADGEGPPCRGLADTVAAREGRLPFVRSYLGGGATMLKVLGQFEVAEIWALDMRSDIASAGRPGVPTVGAYLDDIQHDAKADPAATVVCYGAVIPLDRLLAPPEGGRAFSSLLIAGPKGEILAQLGPEILPLSSIEALRPRTDDSAAQLLKAAVGTTGATLSDQDAKRLAAVREANQNLVDNLAPVDVPVGDRNFIAYVRPFHPPAQGFPACVPEPAKPPAGEDGKVAPAPAPAKLLPTDRGRCHVVALVPKAGLWRQVVNPPPGPLLALALAVGGVLVLLPALRLILLGPGDALGRAEAAALALGIPAAASLATLAVLVAADVGAHRTAAADTADAIAHDAAQSIARELAPRLQSAAARASLLAGLPPDAMGAPLRTAEARLLAEKAAGRPLTPASPLEACLATGIAGAAPNEFVTIGLEKRADPRPLRCTAAPLCRDDSDKGTGLPHLELGGLIAPDGQQMKGLRSLSCRNFPGGRTELGGRDYFRRISANRSAEADLGTGPGRHVVAQVQALQDGLPQTVLARPAPQGDGILVTTTTLPTLVRPVVAAPFQLILVDVRDPRMPVVAHSVPGRAGAERFATMISGGAQVRARLWAESRRHRKQVEADPKAELPRPTRFHAFYDGDSRHFAAVPVPGTSWVAIGAFPESAVDTLPVAAGRRALLSWAVMGMLSGAVWLGWLAWIGRDGRGPGWLTRGAAGWNRLWPQEAHGERYRRLSRELLVMAAIGLGLLALVALAGVAAILLVAVAMLLRAGAAAWLHWRLGAPPAADGPAHAALSPETQRRYRWLSASLILCLSVVPMLGLWADARRLTIARAEAALVQQLASPGGALERRRDAFLDLAFVLGLTGVDEKPVFDAPGATPPVEGAGRFGFHLTADAPTEVRRPLSLAGEIADLQEGAGDPALAGCSGPGPWGTVPLLCGSDGLRGIAWNAPGPLTGRLSLPGYAMLLLLGVGLTALIGFFIARTLKALAGFGIALEAVRYPRLNLRSLWGVGPDAEAPPELQTLNRKSLLVNAPFSILPMLAHLAARGPAPQRRLVSVDLTDPAAVAAVKVAPRDLVLVSGLELVLADPDRRLKALAALEGLARAIDREADQVAAIDEPCLLFFSPTAPMDRILDAYERETAASGTAIDINRENLRWARLFEDFATFQFRPVELTGGGEPAAPPPGLAGAGLDQWTAMVARLAARGRDEQAAIATVFRELRWMSPRVVNGCINEERDVALPVPMLERGLVPVTQPGTEDASPYPAIYGLPVLEWALARHFAGPEAALAYLKGQFIEHYQRLWSASTRAERLVLHHLAHGRFVNIAASVAFGSLVRRGLVVLDPEPRIMNQSFAMFVAQVEKLDAIREWRGELPSAWLKARLPILGAIAAAVLLLAGLLVAGEQPLKLLIPVLAAGGPILAAGLWRTVRGS